MLNLIQDRPGQHDNSFYRRTIISLLVLSCVALAVTIWIMVELSRERTVVENLVKTLPEDAKDSARFLASELRWQFRLITLVVLNVIVAAIAIVLLGRAYRNSQSSLRDVRALANDVLGSMEQAVITTDLGGKVTSINQRGVEFLDVSSDCIGQTIPELAPDSLSLCEYHQQWLAGESTPKAIEYTLKRQGNLQTFRVSCQSLTDNGSSRIGTVIQISDVTERKLIEDRMRRMERYMGLGSLAVGLHHEIKNPLAGLSLHVQLLEEQLEPNQPSDEVKSMLDVIRSEVARIGGVLECFRDFASIIHVELHNVELCELIQGQINFIRPQAHDQKIEVELVECEPSIEISADQGRLEQVLLNLFINAIDAMPAGGRILVSAIEQGSQVLLKITDTGTGIPKKLADKVLDPYFSTKTKGTGLGLAFCDKIMRQHQGSIDFETSPDGTTFTLTFPRTATKLRPQTDTVVVDLD